MYPPSPANLRPRLNLCPQVLSGTAPFPNESDEEVLDRVSKGLRPGRPSNPPKWLADGLWGQIEACWKQEPNERPTASEVLQTLSALSEAQNQGRSPVVAEDPYDEALMLGWEYVKGGPEEGGFLG